MVTGTDMYDGGRLTPRTNSTCPRAVIELAACRALGLITQSALNGPTLKEPVESAEARLPHRQVTGQAEANPIARTTSIAFAKSSRRERIELQLGNLRWRRDEMHHTADRP